MYVQKCKLERNNHHVNNDNVDDDDGDKDIERDFFRFSLWTRWKKNVSKKIFSRVYAEHEIDSYCAYLFGNLAKIIHMYMEIYIQMWSSYVNFNINLSFVIRSHATTAASFQLGSLISFPGETEREKKSWILQTGNGGPLHPN
jgi:hypothetical protein